jgi:hypothetical protein
LCCTDPNGETVWFKNKSVSSGGQLDIDMNVDYPGSITPVENIYWPSGKAPNGSYNVYLINYKNHEPYINNTPYTIKVKYGGKNQVYKGIIKKEDKSLHICSFTLGNPTSPNAPINDQTNSLIQQREKLQKELDRIDRELKEIRNSK